MVHIGPSGFPRNLPELSSRLVPDGLVGRIPGSYRCHFRTCQLELVNLGTENFEIGPVVKKLQPFEVGDILDFLVNSRPPRKFKHMVSLHQRSVFKLVQICLSHQNFVRGFCVFSFVRLKTSLEYKIWFGRTSEHLLCAKIIKCWCFWWEMRFWQHFELSELPEPVSKH